MKIFSLVVAAASAADKCFVCQSRQYAIAPSASGDPT